MNVDKSLATAVEFKVHVEVTLGTLVLHQSQANAKAYQLYHTTYGGYISVNIPWVFLDIYIQKCKGAIRMCMTVLKMHITRNINVTKMFANCGL